MWLRGAAAAWLDAAEFVDDKWERAERQADRCGPASRGCWAMRADNIALGQNTHELVTRWLSALPLRDRRRIVTTTASSTTIRRQLDRLAEEGIEWFGGGAAGRRPRERGRRTVDDRTLAVMVSSVMFETAEIVPGLAASRPAVRATARRCWSTRTTT
jgi:selenocysteine lyase/cysteine desulfurase